MVPILSPKRLRLPVGDAEEEMSDDPAFFLLRKTKIPVKESNKETIVCHLLNAAKACTPGTWKQRQPPPIRRWLKKVEEMNKMEELIWTA